MEITQLEQETERQMKNNESNIWELWNNIKHANLHIEEMSEGEEKKKKGLKLNLKKWWLKTSQT